MGRGRAAVLDGARQAVLARGTAVTMSQVAASAGVAKATLYNHFRTRRDVLDALLDAELDTALTELVDRPLEDALAGAARLLSDHPLLRALGAREPATLAAMVGADGSSRARRRVVEAVAELLAGFDRQGAETVVRWLASFVLSPASSAAIERDVEVLVVGLPSRRSGAAERAGGAAGRVPLWEPVRSV